MAVEDDIVFFERVPTFSVLGREALRVLAIGAETVWVQEGNVLFRAGEAAEDAFLIHTGEFRLDHPTPAKSGKAVRVGKGAVLHDMAMIIETRRPYTATATETSSVIRITRKLFLRVLDSYPDETRRLRDMLATRTAAAVREIYGLHDTFTSHAKPKSG